MVDTPPYSGANISTLKSLQWLFRTCIRSKLFQRLLSTTVYPRRTMSGLAISVYPLVLDGPRHNFSLTLTYWHQGVNIASCCGFRPEIWRKRRDDTSRPKLTQKDPPFDRTGCCSSCVHHLRHHTTPSSVLDTHHQNRLSCPPQQSTSSTPP